MTNLTLNELEILIYAIARAGGEKVLGGNAESARKKLEAARKERLGMFYEATNAETHCNKSE